MFDVKITAGTEYGVLYDPYRGEVSGSLENVLNGFRVITSSSIAEDSVAIILKVRTTLGGELPTGAIMNKREETERTKQESGISKQKINTELLVIGGGEIEGYGKVVVKSNEWCEDLEYCGEIEFPNIEFDVHENNWEGLDACGTDLIAGTDFFNSENSNYREDFDIELCRENNTDKVNFYFDDDITINCVSDMCDDNISARQDILIDDVYSFPANTSCKEKLFWIDLHKWYPYPTKIVTPTEIFESVYVIEDIWMRHEKVHRDHFLEVAEGFKEEYLKRIEDTKKQCSDFINEETAKSFFKRKAEEIIKDFYDVVKNEDDRISMGGDDGGDVITFEIKKIHKKVIDEYLQPLIDRWKLNNCVD